ncbi:MAG: lipid-A-disaccharide synthase N-terminal domain-containing protein [Deltaproteobacteria bacterium]|nr:lipid-A-disaccharide synthase N-terminal domain-containing protein [Deltaproteobacteria bacterium]
MEWNDAIGWLAIGLLGQAAFFSRFLVQWIASERARRSVVPLAFWYLSLAGSLTLLVYAIHRQEPVFALGQSLGSLVAGRRPAAPQLAVAPQPADPQDFPAAISCRSPLGISLDFGPEQPSRAERTEETEGERDGDSRSRTGACVARASRLGIGRRASECRCVGPSLRDHRRARGVREL